MAVNAPATEIGYTNPQSYNWWLYENELTPELMWPQSIYVYDQMRRTDSQVGSILRAVNLLVLRTPWRIDPNGARDEVVQLVADDFGLPIVGETPKSPPRTKDRFSWKDHLSEALLMLPLGHSYFEQVYRPTADGARAHLRKLALRPAKTIERIDVAEDGGLISISQYWTSMTGRPQPIPVNRLVAYIHAKEGGNWLGTSILRNCYKNWLLKDRLLRVQAQTIERNGMGVPLYIGAEGETPAAHTAGLEMAKAWRSGEAAGSAIPFGAVLKLVGVEGTLPDAEPAVRYHDESIAKTVLAHFLNLGQQMGTGSYALGATLGDFFTLGVQTVAQQVADVANMHAVEDLVDVNWGPDEPAPKIVFDEIGSRQAATAAAIKTLVDAGVIRPDEVLEESSRQQYGLPPADPSTVRTPPPAPAAVGAPDPNAGAAQDLFGPSSVAAAAGEPGGDRGPGGVMTPDVSRSLAKFISSSGVGREAARTLVAEYGSVTAVDELPEWLTEPFTESDAAPVQAKFNPDESRIPNGPHGGEWGHGGGIVHDVLHLAGRIQLDPGESLVSSDRAYLGHSGVAKIAVTDLHGRRSIRLGLGGGTFLSDPWRAAPKGLTVKLTTDQVRELTAGLDAAEKHAKAGDAAASKLWDAADAAKGTPGHAALLKKAQDAVDGFVVPTGVVAGEWGDVHYGYRVTDTGYAVTVAVRPDGAPPDWSLEDAAGNDAGVELYDAAGVAQLRKALASAAGRVQADAAFESKHHRGLGGRFVSMVDRLINAIAEHKTGGGKGHPFDGFDREQLRRAARTRGIELKRGEDRDSIAAKLLADLGVPSKSKVKKATPGTAHQGPAIEVAKSLKDLSAVQLTRGEYLTPAGRAALDALGPAGHPRIAAIPDTEEKIREAYRMLAMPGAGTDAYVSFADLRKLIGEQVPRSDVDATLRSMYAMPDVHITAQSYNRGNAATRIPASVRIGDQEQNMIAIADPTMARPSQFGALAMAEELHARKAGSPTDPMMALLSDAELQAEVDRRAAKDPLVARDLAAFAGSVKSEPSAPPARPKLYTDEQKLAIWDAMPADKRKQWLDLGKGPEDISPNTFPRGLVPNELTHPLAVKRATKPHDLAAFTDSVKTSPTKTDLAARKAEADATDAADRADGLYVPPRHPALNTPYAAGQELDRAHDQNQADDALEGLTLTELRKVAKDKGVTVAGRDVGQVRQQIVDGMTPTRSDWPPASQHDSGAVDRALADLAKVDWSVPPGPWDPARGVLDHLSLRETKEVANRIGVPTNDVKSRAEWHDMIVAAFKSGTAKVPPIDKSSPAKKATKAVRR